MNYIQLAWVINELEKPRRFKPKPEKLDPEVSPELATLLKIL